mgnify:CR=1 FL=1
MLLRSRSGMDAHIASGRERLLMLADFVENGVVKGLGAFLVFVPQIALLFVCIEALEDSGYLARAAFLLDRVMGKVGLPGRAFLPER